MLNIQNTLFGYEREEFNDDIFLPFQNPSRISLLIYEWIIKQEISHFGHYESS